MNINTKKKRYKYLIIIYSNYFPIVADPLFCKICERGLGNKYLLYL
jgi:hypothetical protein